MSKITIAQILSHRSGIPDMQQDASWGKHQHTKDEVVARIAQGRPLFEPSLPEINGFARWFAGGLDIKQSVLSKRSGRWPDIGRKKHAASCGKVAAALRKTELSSGAYCPIFSIVLGNVIDIGESEPRRRGVEPKRRFPV